MGKKVYVQYGTTFWYMTLLLMQKKKMKMKMKKYDIYIFFLFIGETISWTYKLILINQVIELGS